jgi:hypothetical protein
MVGAGGAVGGAAVAAGAAVLLADGAAAGGAQAAKVAPVTPTLIPFNTLRLEIVFLLMLFLLQKSLIPNS